MVGRYRELRISIDLLVYMCAGVYEIVRDEMPSGARAVRSHLEDGGRTLVLLIEHVSFESVDTDDEDVPELVSPLIRRIAAQRTSAIVASEGGGRRLIRLNEATE